MRKVSFYAIAGYGFFTHFHVVGIDMAWDLFDWRNGDPDRGRFLERIGGYRGTDLSDPSAERGKMGCTILRGARF